MIVITLFDQCVHKGDKKQISRPYSDHFIWSMPALPELFYSIIVQNVSRF